MGMPLSGDCRVRFQRCVEALGVPDRITDELTEQMILVRYTEGSAIISRGSPATFMFWLARGLVKVYCPNVDGNRVLVRLAGPGELLGYIDCINATGARRHVYEIYAANNCEAALLARDHALKLLHKLEKDELIKLIEDLNTRWSETMFWHMRLFGLDFRDRLEMVLADLGRRFGIKDERGLLITPELSQLDLAEMIGSSRPMISRLVKAMTDSRELVRSGKQYIVTSNATWLTKRSEALLPSPVPSPRPRFEPERPFSNGYHQASRLA